MKKSNLEIESEGLTPAAEEVSETPTKGEPNITYKLGGAIIKFFVEVYQDGELVDSQPFYRDYILINPIEHGLRQAVLQFNKDLQEVNGNK